MVAAYRFYVHIVALEKTGGRVYVPVFISAAYDLAGAPGILYLGALVAGALCWGGVTLVRQSRSGKDGPVGCRKS